MHGKNQISAVLLPVGPDSAILFCGLDASGLAKNRRARNSWEVAAPMKDEPEAAVPSFRKALGRCAEDGLRPARYGVDRAELVAMAGTI